MSDKIWIHFLVLFSFLKTYLTKFNFEFFNSMELFKKTTVVKFTLFIYNINRYSKSIDMVIVKVAVKNIIKLIR